MEEEVSNNFQELLKKTSVDEYCKGVMEKLKTAQKASGQLQGWRHYTDFSGVNMTMTKIEKISLKLITDIFNHQGIKVNLSNGSLRDRFDILREANDALLEKINCELDDAKGFKRTPDVLPADTTVHTVRSTSSQNTGREVILMASRNVQKPQLFFTPKINNSSKEPFIPLIKEKPNNSKPLSVLVCLDASGREYYSHPYEYELENWSPLSDQLTHKEPIKPNLMMNTPFMFVDNETSLQGMMDELKNCSEIAVDVENHFFRSYQGLTSLIQISTRTKDYVIDPFPLRNQLSILNEVFTHPKIIKVFHGADHDILWLQRDLGVYVVNMFDTHQAAIILDYPHRSLSNLLQKFCDVSANKTYQRADWRIRPLPEDFIEYARTDTHYLLYIFECMRNELIEKGNNLNNLLVTTYDRSKDICLKRHEKPMVGSDRHMDLYRKSRKLFNKRQLYALQQLFLWRDRIAREQDESVDYVLPRHMLLQICEILPKEMQGILACCNPIPPLVKTEQLTIHQIIRAARALPLEQVTETLAEISDRVNTTQMSNDVIGLSCVCKHDLSGVDQDPAGLDTLLNPQETLMGDLFSQNHVNVKTRKKSFLFNVSKNSVSCKRALHAKPKYTEFMPPFQRYELIVKKDDESEANHLKTLLHDFIEQAKAQNYSDGQLDCDGNISLDTQSTMVDSRLSGDGLDAGDESKKYKIDKRYESRHVPEVKVGNSPSRAFKSEVENEKHSRSESNLDLSSDVSNLFDQISSIRKQIDSKIENVQSTKNKTRNILKSENLEEIDKSDESEKCQKSDVDRVMKLQQHLESLATGSNRKKNNKAGKINAKNNISEHNSAGDLSNDLEEGELIEDNKGKIKANNKRKSSEFSPNSGKKLKNSMSNPQTEETCENLVEEKEQFTPFNYDKAAYNIFQNSKKHKNIMHVKQIFKKKNKRN